LNNNAKDILSAIKTTLTASTSLVPNTLKAIKLGVDADHDSGFPYCRIYLVDFASEIADTISYRRTYTFAVEIWQEYSQKSKENAELDFCNAIDAVVNRLNGTWQLGIGVEKSEVQVSLAGNGQANGAPLRAASIRLQVTTLVQNPS
jgi:hypothetical protein